MTTEIEKKFFDTFGIEPYQYRRYYNCACYERYCKDCEIYKNKILQQVYPEITDRILLNLILIMNPYAPPVGDTMEEMKEQVLYWCTQYANKIKHKVQALFEEG